MTAMPGFSFLVSAVTAFLAYGARAFSRSSTLFSLLVSVAATGVGAMNHIDWITSLGVLAGSVFLGVTIGRIIPPRPGPMLLLLIILSVADVIWIASGGGSASESVERIANLAVQIGETSSSIGTVDLALAAVVATHWLQRGAGMWLAVTPAPIGMLASNVYVAVSGAGNLPLVPFITVGWLLTEGWHRRRTDTTAQLAEPS